MCIVCGCGGHRGRGLRESVLSELFRSVRVTGALSVLYVRKTRVTRAAGDCLTFRFFHGVFVGSDLCGFPKGLERIANPFLLRVRHPKHDLKPSFGQRLESRVL